MLLSFVLVGRAVEERAKLQASSDMASLLSLLPTTANLLLGASTSQTAAGAATGHQRTREVASAALVPGDLIVVRPGDRMPVDGKVVAGGSSVDESAFTVRFRFSLARLRLLACVVA